MRKLSIAGLIAVGVALVPLTSSADRQGASAQVGERTSPPGEGVLCAWAIYTAVAEVGRKCHAGEHLEIQAEMDNIVSHIDAYVLANSTPPYTPAQVEQFKRRQGHTDAPAATLCASEDSEQLYQALIKAGIAEIRKSTDELLARPGNPQWGTCL